ncbi:hypothetical protein G9A89_011079 [Geosiphon pyriformis]|nr:hypothetical protein G9A89_011079 [Geosiphon pyriformis]
MSHCREEHDAHSHDHEGSNDHNHDHDHEGPERGFEESLYSQIDRDSVRCLNESEIGSGKNVIKPWNEREDTTKVWVKFFPESFIKDYLLNMVHFQFLESDVDEQLLLFIPFTGNVKLKSIWIKAGPGSSCPAKLNVSIATNTTDFIDFSYINQDNLDFDAVETYLPTQTWELLETREIVEYTTRISKMSNVQNLTLFFPENYGDDITRIYFVGLKGEWTQIKKDPIITLYEATPNLGDHKTQTADQRIHHTVN